MDVGHQQVAGADPGNPPVGHRPPVDGDVLPDPVVVADYEFGLLAPVLQILGRGADRGKGAYNIAGAEGCRPGYDRMRLDDRFCADPDPFFNNSITELVLNALRCFPFQQDNHLFNDRLC